MIPILIDMTMTYDTVLTLPPARPTMLAIMNKNPNIRVIPTVTKLDAILINPILYGCDENNKIENVSCKQLKMTTISINAKIISSIRGVCLCGHSPDNVNMGIIMRDKKYLRVKYTRDTTLPIHELELPPWVHEIIILPCRDGKTKISGEGIFKTYILNICNSKSIYDDEWIAVIIVDKDSFVDDINVSQ